MATELARVELSVSDEAIERMREEFSGLTADTTSGYEEVRKAISCTRSYRVAIEKKRVELKADALEWGRKVDAEAKRLTALLLEIEEPLKAQKQAVDDAKEQERLRKEREARERLEAEVRAKREAEEARIKAEREAEESRLAEERLRLEAERKRIEAEQAKVAEELRKQREAEAARQAEERRKIEEERRRLEEEAAKQAAIRAAEEERLRAERERLEKAEAARQAEREAAERAERLRIEADRRARQEAEEKAAHEARLRALEPDRVKIRRIAESLRAIDLPRVSQKESKQFVSGVAQTIQELAAKCESFGA